ncbi:MAG: heparinase II/III-family protein [Oscillospiraceae bacterium]|jgi:hypothetical protein|nr:heparinase II/III-family protein [Oscillospiraceae bacterium]
MFAEYLEGRDLLPLLAPKAARLPFASAADRAAWQTIAPAYHQRVLAAARTLRAGPYPTLSATQFLAFCRTGDRRAYEDAYFARRHRLLANALAACLPQPAEARDACLDDVIDGIWCLCEESFWGISAHNGSDHPGARPARECPLPDAQNPYIDLFAAQTAALLSWACHLLDEALDAATPIIRRRVRMEVERRVLTPFFYHDDFWWMGMIRRDVNNWTPWILSNVMAALLIWADDDRRLADGLARGMRMLDAYLAVMPEDGGCDEGAAYWNVAGASLLDCLELLYTATAGRVCFYEEPLIRRIGAFPLHAHIAGPYYWNFADCDARPMLDGERVHRYGLRTDNPALAALGARIAADTLDPLPRGTPEISRVMNLLFAHVPPGGEAPAPSCGATLPHLQVWARQRGGLYAAIKGGHNGENHNHNDVGSFLLYIDGEPAIIDLGNMVYTAQTFGPDRYALPNTRSRNHNLPLIGPYEQAAGRIHAARDLRFWDDSAVMDIAGAYPAGAGVSRLLRTFGFEGGALALHDEIALTAQLPVCWVFMLRHKPKAAGAGCIAAGPLRLGFDPALAADWEEMPVTDTRMAANFPGSVYRLTLCAKAAAYHARAFAFSRIDPPDRL